MLLDTNLLIRTLQPHHPLFAIADAAIQRLPRQGADLMIVPQNLMELWVVATRPAENNGLGLSLKAMFSLLPETPAVYQVWESLVIRHHVSGKPAHDARLVAAMQVHGIRAILTFDRSGFSRYPGIDVVHPADVVATT